MKLNIQKQYLAIFFVAFACIFLALGNVLGFGAKTAVAFIGVAVVILSFSYPSVPLYILILGIPLESKTAFLTLGKGINFTNLMLILMFIGWIMRVVIKKERMFFKNPLNIPIFLYLLIALFAFFRGSLFWGYEFSGDVMTAFKQSMMFFIIFYFAVNCVRTDTERKILFFLIALMVCYEGTVAIRQHHGVEHSIYVTESRVTGTFGSEEGGVVGANELGAFFAQYAPLFLAGVLVLRSFLMKGGFALLYGICAVSAMYTFSRAAYVAMIMSAMAMFFIRSKKSIFLFIIMGMIVLAVAPGPVRERFTSIRYEDKSTETRKAIWANARYHIVRSPLIGYGFNSSSHMLSRDTHNMYYDIALEMGIPQLLLLFFIFWRIYKLSEKLRNAPDSTEFERMFALAMLGSLIALGCANVFGTRLNYFPINAYFMIMVGIMTRLSMEKEYVGKQLSVNSER